VNKKKFRTGAVQLLRYNKRRQGNLLLGSTPFGGGDENESKRYEGVVNLRLRKKGLCFVKQKPVNTTTPTEPGRKNGAIKSSFRASRNN